MRLLAADGFTGFGLDGEPAGGLHTSVIRAACANLREITGAFRQVPLRAVCTHVS
jgi:hypothetical protein